MARRRARVPLSVIPLVGANVAPLAGVAVFDWRVLDTLIVYGLEIVIIGGVNVARMLRLSRGQDPGNERTILAAVFAVHYGLFCFAYVIVVGMLFTQPLVLGERSGWTRMRCGVRSGAVRCSGRCSSRRSP